MLWQIIDRGGSRAIGGFTYLLTKLCDVKLLGSTTSLPTHEYNKELQLYVCLVDTFTAKHVHDLVKAVFATKAPLINLELTISS